MTFSPFEEFRRRWRRLDTVLEDMRSTAEQVATREGLTGTIFICMIMGRTRDDSGLGFEYPKSKQIEERLNRNFQAKGIKEWAMQLPPEERDAYLQDARRKGWDGYL